MRRLLWGDVDHASATKGVQVGEAAIGHGVSLGQPFVLTEGNASTLARVDLALKT
jgi:hypothetical protein